MYKFLFDIREYSMPPLVIQKRIIPVLKGIRPVLDRRLKATALIMEDNIWNLLLKGIVAACLVALPPVNPFLMCASPEEAWFALFLAHGTYFGCVFKFDRMSGHNINSIKYKIRQWHFEVFCKFMPKLRHGFRKECEHTSSFLYTKRRILRPCWRRPLATRGGEDRRPRIKLSHEKSSPKQNRSTTRMTSSTFCCAKSDVFRGPEWPGAEGRRVQHIGAENLKAANSKIVSKRS